MINEEVLKLKTVLVIDESGKQLGVMSSSEALMVAQVRDLDLFCVNPKMATPVCKILNYGKYKFEQEKREKMAKKNSAKVESKEVQMSMQIAKHDMETKAKQVQKFISKGDYVRIVMRLRGREVNMKSLAFDKFHEFLKMIGDYNVRKPENFIGRDIMITIEKKK